MTAQVSLAQSLFRQDIFPKVVDQLTWVDTLIADGIEKDSAWQGAFGPQVLKMLNNKFEITSLDGGMTAYAGGEIGTLVNSDLDFSKMYVTPTFTTSSFRITLAAIEATTGNDAALKSLVSQYNMECGRSILRQKGRYLRGDGSGIVGILPIGAVTSNTITISGKAAGTIASQNIYGLGANQVFQPGAAIEFGTEAAFAAGTQVVATVSAVPNNTTLVLTGTVTVGAAATGNNRAGTNADTWHIRFSGTYGKVPMGLLGMLDSASLFNPTITSFQGLVRADAQYLNSTVLNPANATTIQADFRSVYIDAQQYNTQHKFWVVSQDVYAKYTDSITVTVQAQQSSMAYTNKLGSIHTGLAFAYGSNPIPVLLDVLLPYGTALLLDSDQYFITELLPDTYVTDGILTRVPGANPIYETVRASYYNYGTFSPRKLWARIQYQSV